MVIYFSWGKFCGAYRSLYVVTIDQGDVVEILSLPSTEGDFSEGYWWGTTVSGALETVSTVTSLAVLGVGVAPGTGPETASPLVITAHSPLQKLENLVKKIIILMVYKILTEA